MLRVLVVDDSALSRKLIGDHLGTLQDVEVVGRASNGKIALEQIPSIKPDLLTLDLEMPLIDGIGVLQKLRGTAGAPKVLLITGADKTAPERVQKAIELGVVDVVVKPHGSNGLTTFQAQLGRTIEALARQGRRAPPAAPKKKPMSSRSMVRRGGRSVIAIGISTGGPAALGKMLPQLPANLKVPVLIVQHIPEGFSNSLADALDSKCKLPVKEAVDGQVVAPGHIYLAPGGRHMIVRREQGQVVLALTDGPPVNHCRPAVDVLFGTVAEVYGDAALGVIMTGMGDDGAKGLGEMRKKGAYVLGQDEASCTVYGMPMRAAEAGVVDEQVALDDLAGRILACVRGS